MSRPMYVSVRDIQRDPDQTAVYNLKTDKHFVVEGSAGSGKSSLALLFLQRILADRGEDDDDPTQIYYITTSHELVECVRQQFEFFDTPPRFNDYAITGGADGMWGRGAISDLQRKMQDPRGPYYISSRRCMLEPYDRNGFQNERIRINKHPNYLLIDEAQDFKRAAIEDFLASATSGCVFYGDDTQKIMGFADPMSLSDIELLLKAKFGETDSQGKIVVYKYRLKRNWRLSREIAAFAQALPNGVADPMLLERSRGEYREKPILKQVDPADLIQYIKARAISATTDDDTGIILRTNDEVKVFYDALRGMGNVSARYSISPDSRDYRYLQNTPVKIMTYENAKGQQFRDVYLLADKVNALAKEELNRFYVGVTRAERFLRILYSGNKPAFLANVDPDLYIEE